MKFSAALFKEGSIRQRIMLACTTAALVAMVPLFLISYYSSKASTEARAIQFLTEQLETVGLNFVQGVHLPVQRALKRISVSVLLNNYLTGAAAERQIDRNSLETLFVDTETENEDYTGVFFIDGSGAKVLQTRNGKRSRTAEGEDTEPNTTSDGPATTTDAQLKVLFEKIKNTPALLSVGNMQWFMPPRQMEVSPPFVDESGRLSLLASLPRLDSDSGAFGGVIVIRIDLTRFVNLLRAIKVFDEAPIWLFSGTGQLLAKPDQGVASFNPATLMARELTESQKFQMEDAGLIAYRDLTMVPGSSFIRIAFAVPEHVLVKDFSSAAMPFFPVMLVSFLLAITLAYFVARALSSPLVQLVGAASRVARGDLTARVQADAGGEIGVLVESFNQMSTNLQRSNEGRREAMNLLRTTLRNLKGSAVNVSDGTLVPTNPLAHLDGNGENMDGNDEDNLHRVSELLTQMLAEREQHLTSLNTAKLLADQASSAKSDFLATMSHEIRTPLNAIIGLSDVLRSTALSPDQDLIVGTMGSSGAQLLAIINDVLDFSRLQSGGIELFPTPLELRPFLQQLMLIVKGLPGASRLAIDLQVDPDVPQRMMADGTRVMQIMLNLLGNAVKFTREGAVTLRVSTGYAEPDGQFIALSVTDSGPGIPLDARERIFEPFIQLASHRLSPQPGTGLGLSICMRLARAVGGTIHLESATPRGSIFRLHVPLITVATENIQSTAPQPLPELDAKPLRILVAEDTPASQLVIKLLLERMGHTVTIAEDGRVAVDAFDRGNFDLVILDIQMPNMDGMQAARLIRASGPDGETVPIIALTAFARPEDRSKAIDAGMTDFVPKPVRMKELMLAISRSFSQQQHK